MSRNKSTKRKSPAPPKKAAPAAKDNRTMWVVGLIAVALVAGVAWANATRPKSSQVTAPASSPASTPAAVPAEEQKYIGRLLPAGYQEPSVKPVAYTSVTKMTDVAATTKGSQVSVPLADVTTDKIVYFEYKKAGSDAIPMIAYVKPSGRLFVGVSYCIPCRGERQYIDADGTLTCASCGTKRDLEAGTGISGACRLYPLDEIASTIVGGKIVIDRSALDQWTPQPSDRPVG